MVRRSGRSRGCEICRRQKVKCDEQQPECAQCIRRGKNCPGPWQGLIIFQFQTEPKQPTKFRLVKEEIDLSQSEIQEPKLMHNSAPDLDRNLGPGALDPFLSTAIPLNTYYNEHLHHFMLHTTKVCIPFRPEMKGLWFWQDAISQPALFYSLLALSASHRFHLQLNNAGSRQAKQWMLQSLELHSKAIQSTKRILCDEMVANIQPIATIIGILISLAACNSSIDEMDVHMSGLRHLIQIHGGIDVLPISTISFLMSVDNLWAMVKCTVTVLPLSSRWASLALNHPYINISNPDKLPIGACSSLGLPRREQFRSLGSRFTNSSWCDCLDNSFKIAIENFVALFIHYEIYGQQPQHKNIITFGDNDPWTLAQRFLLSLSYEHLGPNNIQEPLRRSILAFSLTRYCNFTMFPCMDTIVTNLRSSLIPTLELLQCGSQDLLFWILYVGALSSRHSFEAYNWYCVHLSEVSRALGLFDWDEARSLLEQFLYVHRPSDKLAEKIWQDALSLREQREKALP
ncbi:hypothetical protein BGZ63DRAFT_238306 [Mariannaea sp. PMI_226]|nr:hypothetical protein BGZ63DRAFT_238306 [Mariannaea sp. PMI_226]